MASHKCLAKTPGFTLIEVLIALAILSIALTAIIKATSTDIQSTSYLKDKATARWVALEAKHLIELNAIAFEENEAKQVTHMLEKDWHWSAQKYPSSIAHMLNIHLTVYAQNQPIVSSSFAVFKEHL